VVHRGGKGKGDGGKKGKERKEGGSRPFFE